MQPAAIKPEITLDELDRIDIRAGAILEAHAVEGSRKLVRLVVDFGDHQRNILAGIAQERDNPAEVVGRQALFVVNLPAREMAGVRSEGMLFDVGYADGITPVLAVTESPVPNGARAG
jgi:tRNA-binding protein